MHELLTHDGIKEAVDRGVRFLNEERPDWTERVDPTDLNMDHGRYCVIGQLYDEGEFAVRSGWAIGSNELDLWGVVIVGGTLVTRAIYYGFALPHGAPETAWAALTQQWIARLS